MRTSKVISNISYNSIDHFEGVVTDLEQRGVIEWCYWIAHRPDTDELKAHIHFVLKPSGRLDTADLYKEFLEIDRKNSKPLGVTKKWNFTNSMDDWLLYAVHDIAYLKSKGQYRRITYKFDDLNATDLDALRMDWNAIDRRKFDRLEILEDAVEKKVPFAVLVQQSVIPISQRAQYESQYQALVRLKFDGELRGGGRITPHEEDNTVDLMQIEDMKKYLDENQVSM